MPIGWEILNIELNKLRNHIQKQIDNLGQCNLDRFNENVGQDGRINNLEQCNVHRFEENVRQDDKISLLQNNVIALNEVINQQALKLEHINEMYHKLYKNFSKLQTIVCDSGYIDCYKTPLPGEACEPGLCDGNYNG